MRVECVEVGIHLVQIEQIGVVLVRYALEPAGAGLAREGVARGLLGRPDEVVAVLWRLREAVLAVVEVVRLRASLRQNGPEPLCLFGPVIYACRRLIEEPAG